MIMSPAGVESPAQCGASKKGAKMFRKITVEVTAVGLALTVLASVAQAEATELTDAQMELITAGAFQVVATTSNLVDSRQITYTFRPATSDFIDNSSPAGVVWTPRAVYWYANNTAFGVLTNAAGQTWDGGFTVTPMSDPIRVL
jgi:hypothetical protein